ncbi:MAG: NAD(P)-dependent oxidoreductase [Acidobacteriota bacterium]|nr:NAD(P)-dependent oxidoreductase [Acidobacteriota bacterium]
MANLGYIGLGVMGSRMVNRLLDKGHTVTGYNRTRSKAQWLIDRGMRWADSPREVVEAAGITFSMLTDSAALEEVVAGPGGVLAGIAPGKIFIDMSTVSPAISRELADRVRAKGGEMVDAPVSGSVITLEQGKLSVMVGGRPDTFEVVKPLLLDLGPKVTHVGANGLALVMKIATNLSLAVQMLAFSEGVLLAEKSGIARETAVDVLTHSVIGSPMVQYRGPFVLKMPGEAWFNVNMMQKDMLLALELGRQVNVPLPTTSATNQMLTAARGLGLADRDFAIVFEVLARLSGIGAD